MSGIKTLLVEDDDATRAVLERLLADCRCSVTALSDGESAWEAFLSGEYQLVVLDWILPGLDGLELCRKMRAHDHGRSFIFMITSRGSQSDLEAVLNAGADDYLSKPVDAAQLRMRLAIAERNIRHIAERKRAEEALSESVERFYLAAQGTSDGFWHAVPQHDDPFSPDNECWYSPRLKELLGYADHELPNTLGVWRSRLHPDDEVRVFKALRDHLERHVPYDIEYRFRTKSGGYLWFSARGQALWDSSGRPLRMAGSLRDVTQRRQIEGALRESEARFRLIAEKVTDLLWTARLASERDEASSTPDRKDRHPGDIWRFTYVSPAIERLLHYTPEEALDLGLRDILTKESYDRAMETLREELALDLEARDLWRQWTLELEHVTKEGMPIWCEVTNTFLRDTSGAPIGVIGVTRDITERKRTEQALRASEEKWRSLVANAPDFILLADREGKILFMNRTAPGYSLEQVVGTSAYEYLAKDHQFLLRNAIDKVFELAEASIFEVAGQGTNRQPAWYVTRVGPVKVEGTVAAAVIIATDISERRRIEVDLRDEQRLLRNVLDVHERERKLIAYEIHDGLVQHMTAALMHLDASSVVPPDDDARRTAEFDRGAALLRTAVGEARRLISGLRPPILDERGIVPAIEYLVNEARVALPEVEFTHQTSFNRLAPPLESAVFRVVQEALTNVRRHSHAKRARVRLSEQGDRLRVEIRDWGRGFDVDNVHHDSFGLHGIRQRARLLGGSAQVLSSVGAGTEILVEFPLVLSSH